MIRQIFSVLIVFSLISIVGGIILVENVRIARGDTNSYNDDPVAYWSFNEGSGSILFDQSGNNNHGVIYGATWTSGISGKALYFDGINDYVAVNDSDTLDVTDGITIEAWIKPALVSSSYIVSKLNPLIGGSVYTLDIYPGKIRTILQKVGGGSTSYGTSGTSSIIADIWQHLVVTCDGTIVKIYYNGRLEGTNPFSGQISTSTGPLIIGNYLTSYFKGYIDEIRIYDYALSEEQIHLHSLSPIVFIDDDYTAVIPGWNYTHFSTIQEGVDAVALNGAVYVYNGTYYENVNVDKNLDLIGKNKNTTIIDAFGNGGAMYVNSDGVNISGFTVMNSTEQYIGGITLNGVQHCQIFDVIATANNAGIRFDHANNNLIQNCIVKENTWGIHLYYSSYNDIINNSVHDNTGLSIYSSGIYIYPSSHNNIISQNTVINNRHGIYIWWSDNNTVNKNILDNNSETGIRLGYHSGGACSYNDIHNNTLKNNGYGIYSPINSNNNLIYRNNLVNNADNAYDEGDNQWDYEYPLGGNYWSDFDESSEGAFDNDSDGIIDSPYFIPGGENLDRHPLMISHGTINQLPTCILSATPNSGTVSLTVTFTMTANDPDGTIGKWALDINNDGTAEYSGSGAPPSTQQHTYHTPGSYTAKLTVTDNNEATDTGYATVNVLSPGGINTLYVGGVGSGNYTTIQSAIDNASEGDKIFVYNGTYYENIMMDTPLILMGEYSHTTIINASGYGDVITVTSSNCTISGFTLINSGSSDGGHLNCGIYCDNYSPWITNNILTGNNIGIGCWNSASPIIQNNNITNNTNNGIYVYASFPLIENNNIMGNGDNGITLRATASPTIIGNTIIFNPNGINCNYVTGSLTYIKNNNISYNQKGIKSDGSVNIFLNSNTIFNNSDISISLSGSCTNNTIANNTIRQSHVGIHLSYSRNNILSNNTIQANQLGIRLFYSSNNNTVKANTLVSNTIGLYLFSNSSGNLILQNTITTSTTRGINIQSSSNNNSILHNNFIDNTDQARDDGTNVWDHEHAAGGNYWSDFDEPSEGAFDNDSDGIIDTPYFIPGGDNSDRYPLTMPYNLTINKPPTCALSATPTSGTLPLTVTFTMTASDPDGTIVTWKLDINNDGTAEYNDSGAPPSTQQHTYHTPGSYTAKLTVTDNQSATSSDTITITVSQAPIQNQQPEASFMFSPATTFVDENIFFDASSSIDPDGSLVSYEWDFNNDGIYDKTGITTTHSWSSAGEYRVSLKVKDNNGSTDIYTITLTVELTINLQPTCSLTVNPTSGTAPLKVTFTLSASDTDGSINTWALDINNDGTADYSGSGLPPSTQQHSYQTAGGYTAKLMVTDNDGATNSAMKTITVNQPLPDNQPPIANFSYSIDEHNVTFTDISYDSDGDIIAWYWDFGDDNFSTLTNPTHTYQEKGSYTATLTVTDNNQDTDTYSKIIIVTVEEDSDGIPGFEYLPLMASFLVFLFLFQRKRKLDYK